MSLKKDKKITTQKLLGLSIAVLFAVSVIGVTGTINSAEADDDEEYEAEARGKYQRPPVDTPAKIDVDFEVHSNATEIEYKIKVKKLKNPAFIHLHTTSLDAPLVPTLLDPQTGPHVMTLWAQAPHGEQGYGKSVKDTFNGKFYKGTITGNGSAFEHFSDLHGAAAGYTFEDLLADMRAGNLYVNAHTNADDEDSLSCSPNNTGITPLNDCSKRTNTGHGDVWFPGEVRGLVELD